MSKFLRVRCDCGEDMVVYGDSKTEIYCEKCGNLVAEPKGGRAVINCRIIEVLS